jgi:hypothetical protein
VQEKPLARRLEMGRRRLAAVPAGEASVGPILLDEASVVFLRRARADTSLFATLVALLPRFLSLCAFGTEWRSLAAKLEPRAVRQDAGLC